MALEDDDYDPEAEQRRQDADRIRNAEEIRGPLTPEQKAQLVGGLDKVQGQFGSYTNYGALQDPTPAGDPEYNRRQFEFEGQTDWGAIESALRQAATQRGVTYDPSDLEGIRRNAGYDAAHQGAGGGYASKITEFYNNALQNYDQRASNTPNQQSGGGNQSMSSRSGSSGSSGINYNPQGSFSGTGDKANQLWQMYMQRATQGLNVDRNSPQIRGAADAYSANEERARRNYLADTAERGGPYANLRGEERLSAERVGQRSGQFESQLVLDELKSKRVEIENALSGLSGLLTNEQRLALQEKLGLIDAQIREQQLELQSQALELDWSQFGLSAEDRAAYWDAIRRGLL